MRVQTRETALQGEFVRLYARFIRDGQLSDPWAAPVVYITTNSSYQESSSLSTDVTSETSDLPTNGTGLGPFSAKQESQGVWYLDWFVPAGEPVGWLFDVWSFNWSIDSNVEQKIFQFEVHSADDFINWVSPNIVHQIGPVGASMLYDLNNLYLYEAQHIPVYKEQGLRLKNDKNLTKFGFYCGRTWNDSPAPIIYQNNRILPDGWYTDYKASVYFDSPRDPEDIIEASYQFRYFSDEELMQFLLMGLYKMNSVPPSSQNYTSLGGAPFSWRYGIMLQAAILGLQRLVFGLNFQEKSLIFGEDWTIVQQKIDNLKSMYSEWSEQWKEDAKNIKTMRLPGISQVVTPEYTLPGGRSRWFRYLYK
jgi:hypothetical protein